MVKTRAFLSLALFVVLSDALPADPEVGITSVPDWAEELQIEDFPTDRSGQFQLGVAFLLSDRQIRKVANGYEYVERTAYEVVDRSGLESSARIARSFDPTSEVLSFNFVRVLRNGEEIDQLTGAEITLLRQEEGLASSLIDGNITALIELQDVRVGDVIDYSLSGSVASRLWPNDIFEAALVRWPFPLAQMHFRLLVPEDMKLHVRGMATDIEPLITENDGWKSFKLHVRDLDPIHGELNVPGDWVSFGYVVFSSMDSWSDIVDWAIPLFSFDEPMPGEFAGKLDEIADAYSRPQDRATQALRLVQADIRYLGLEVGLGSHVPRSPSVTLEHGYGDCKDKSVLLVAALEYLGINADPALASTIGGDLLPDLPPTIGGFNHMIVQVDIDGRKYWMDPTLSHQGGNIETLANLGYGYVLPIRSNQSELVQLDKPLPDLPGLEIVETFEFPETGEVGLRVTVEHTYRSAVADFSRFQFSTTGTDLLARGLLDYYAANYDGITVSRPLTINDDLGANLLVLQAEYEMGAGTFQQSDYGRYLPISASAVQGILPSQVEANRVAPLALPYGTNVRHVVRIVTPGRKMPLPESKSKTVGGISYTRNFRHVNDAFEMEFVLVVSEDVAETEAIKSVIDLADEIAEDFDLNVLIGAAVAALSKQLGLAAPLDSKTESAIMLVRGQYGRREYVEALTGLNTLIGEYTEVTDLRGYLQQFKGLVLFRLGRTKAAVQPFEEGFELYEPATPESYFRYIDVLGKTGGDARAVQMITRMLENHPQAAVSLNMDWMRRFWRHLRQTDMAAEKDALVVAIARAVHETRVTDLAKFRWVIEQAMEIQSRSGNISEATQYLPYLQDPIRIARLLANRKTEAIWGALEQEAGANLSKAIMRYVSITQDAISEDPNDFKKLTQHVAALRIAEQFEEAYEFAEPIVRNWPQIEAVGDEAYWFVNQYAYLLSDAGFPDKSQALMSRLLEFGITENSALVSMAINRIEIMLDWGESAAVLAAIEEMESLDHDLTSDFGWMWIYQSKACALEQLGHTQEAAAVLRDSIAPNADDNPRAHTMTLLCLDQLDKAAETVVDRLNDENKLDDAISFFVGVSDLESMPPFVAELETRANKVRARPELQAELNKVGRVISINGSSTTWITY